MNVHVNRFEELPVEINNVRPKSSVRPLTSKSGPVT